jgi:uncharacterized protein (DUF885 family)
MSFNFSRLRISLIILIGLALFFSACSNTNSTINTNAPPTDPDTTTDNDPPPTSPEQTLTAAPRTADSAIQQILDDLSGLPLNEFFERSFLELSLRYPESLVELGVDADLGVEGDALNNLTIEYLQETMQLEAGILEILISYDQEELTTEELISYQVYEWFLRDSLRLDASADYQYLASFMILNSEHNQTFQFFTYTHPVNTVEQAYNYIARLNKLDEKFEQLVERLQRQAELGIIPPQFTIDWALYGLHGQTSSVAASHPFYGAFQEKLRQLEGLSAEDRDALLEQAEEAIENAVLPAYQTLIAELERQRGLASEEEMGLWQFDGGEEYYQLLLQHYTTTDLTADEIFELGQVELERIHSEMRAIFDQLGYPQDEDLASLYDRVALDGGMVAASDAAEEYEQIISETYLLLDQAFEIAPQAEVIVIGGPEGDYYTRGSLDGSRPGTFYVQILGDEVPVYEMRTLAYHETVPGHHFQIELAREMDLPTFRREVGSLGYIEGWALYTERLAYDLGWYADDPYGNLGRLQAEALRAARLVVDTGLHTKGWTFEQAVDFFYANVGWSRQDCERQIARYIVLPGQATAYMVGMLQMLGLRQQAMDQLGEDFDLGEFHTVVLDGGAIPLSMLEEKVEAYIAEKLSE